MTVVYEGGGTSSTEVTTRPPGGTDSLVEPLRGLKGVAPAVRFAFPFDEANEATVPVSAKKRRTKAIKILSNYVVANISNLNLYYHKYLDLLTSIEAESLRCWA